MKIAILLLRSMLLLAAIYLNALSVHAQPAPEGQPLSKAQLEQLHRGYGMFIHFGLNTFNETEWSDGTLPVSSYKPTHLDCDQWVKTAKEAGFSYVILITKHHDGFCLWNSKYTDYGIASSPVKTDIVAAVAKACKKYGLKLGLYYSLWDRHEPVYKDDTAYLGYMKKQLTELLTNYGSICEIWFDGGWDKKETQWNIPEIYKLVKKLQPNCMVTVNHTIGETNNSHAIGQPVNFKEGDPIRFFPVDFRSKDPNLARWDDPKLYTWQGKKYYLPFEHTLCISDRWNWFQKKAMVPARPADELEELFYWCTANNNIMILNIPPDQTGRIRENERQRILQVADRLGIRNGKNALPAAPVNLAFNKKVTATSQADAHPATMATDYSLETYWEAKQPAASLEIDFGKAITFNRVSIMENAEMKDLGDDFSSIRIFRIGNYELQAYTDDKWTSFFKGDSIGACKIIKLSMPLTAQKIRLTILDAGGAAGINHISVAEDRKRLLRKVGM